MRYFLYFAYRGTDFHGWQRQPNGISVQEVLEDALTLILRTPTSVVGAGRTDAGVHAQNMIAHFDTDNELLAYDANLSPCGGNKKGAFLQRMNGVLPESIAVHDIRAVRDDAHARFDAIRRTYEYRVTFRKDPFMGQLLTRLHAPLDFEAMNDAAKILLETDDFGSFCKLHTDVKTTLCNVTRADWQPLAGVEGAYVFTITANRFLRNMVRAVVGTLFEVGRGKMTKQQFADIVAQKHRTAAGMSAPAEGLFLVDVAYPEEIFI